MESLTLTKRQALRFILAHQGLWPPYSAEGKSGILDFIRHVGCIQPAFPISNWGLEGVSVLE